MKETEWNTGADSGTGTPLIAIYCLLLLLSFLVPANNILLKNDLRNSGGTLWQKEKKEREEERKRSKRRKRWKRRKRRKGRKRTLRVWYSLGSNYWRANSVMLDFSKTLQKSLRWRSIQSNCSSPSAPVQKTVKKLGTWLTWKPLLCNFLRSHHHFLPHCTT